MIFGAPVWFWLLAAIATPVAVHLWNRKSGKPQLLGTFRFLPERSFAKAGRIELHEVPLLTLRVLIVLLIVLLLAGLFIPRESEKMETIKIIETSGEYSEVLTDTGILELNIPGRRIDEIGWWRIFEQIEYEYRPDVILAEGGTGLNRFSGKRPGLNAMVEWTGETSPADPDMSSTEPVDFRLTVRENLEDNRKQGFRFTADLWDANYLEETLRENLLAVLHKGEEEFELLEIERESENADYLGAGPVTGVRISVNLFDDSIKVPNAILYSAVNRVPVLWEDPENNQRLWLNSEPETVLSAWFYSAAAQQLFKMAGASVSADFPELTNRQRYPLERTETMVSGMKEKSSAVTWLFILLLICWAAERSIAPKREM